MSSRLETNIICLSFNRIYSNLFQFFCSMQQKHFTEMVYSYTQLNKMIIYGKPGVKIVFHGKSAQKPINQLENH